MFCGKCGKQLEDDEVVCPWCGEATGVEVGEKKVFTAAGKRRIRSKY